MALLPVPDALEQVLAGTAALPTETVRLDEAGGRTLAQDIKALRTQPPFSASAMDGYAVRAANVSDEARLRVIGTSAAGRGFAGMVGAGETVRIFTGAPLPAGADAVVIQENATPDGEHVTLKGGATPGRHVRAAGVDFSEGETLLHAGQRLDAGTLALAAAMGHPALPVHARPLVAVLATGDELVPPGTMPGPDQIVASNSYAIGEIARRAGARVLDLGIAPDDRGALAKAIAKAQAAGADILVTLGGASVGEHDLVHGALTEAGMEGGFWKIAMRPGKPFMFGTLGRMRALGLPGNPVSSIVCAILFLAPLVQALSGDRKAGNDPTIGAWLDAALRANDERQDYLRASLRVAEDGRMFAAPFDRQDSSLLSVIGRAQALIVRAPHAPAAEAGSPCRIIHLADYL
jgi:molybdopterin molybdotransferase